jgi:hypothetical protein
MPKKQFTAGIHNYCDRRCERCDSTDRCLLHHDAEKADRRARRCGKDLQDLDAVLKEVGRAFARARRLIVRGAKRMGIDLNEIVKQAARMSAPDHSMIDKHPLALEGMTYFKTGQELVKAVGEDIDATRKDIARRSRFMDVEGEAEELRKVFEAVDVLGWDISLVAVKIKRALSLMPSSERWCIGGERDYEGESSRLARIASIDAYAL